MSVLGSDDIRREFQRSWTDSNPDTDSPHEEGGFVLAEPNEGFRVARWPLGSRNKIVVPPHPDGNWDGALIVATFHTHPNAGVEYQQEPSLTDIRAVVGDPDLRHQEYEGEYVISTELIYRISPEGAVESIGRRSEILTIE